MKKITFIIIFILISFTEGKSQNLELGFGIGTGTAYIIENSDSGINIDYSTPFSSYVDLKYSKSENYFGAKVRFQYLNSGIKGTNWKNNSFEIDGEVTSLTTFILLEHLESENWNFGYNFGFGYSNQILRPDSINSSNEIVSNYMSFHLGGILNKRINENFSFKVEPSVLWTDPVNSFRNSDKWQIAGEDISLLLQFGVIYRIN
ncbi:hypothetical protein GCM10007103_35160 [Salinimicrobium marinum]|uniref:Outer membrane protein beta-barrel domain-containing protein n=1 Tax=Salinimicrobium marinum TaxID=680283 RepID=A0A918W1Y4_9FLAO|nr:hypothetical protein [Salinimicrobium marinum]GHA51658.1 hypothetical protein GCM10007103_35160 [Salinimicrobium marinum]